MNEHRQNRVVREIIYRKILLEERNSRNTNWMVDPFTQEKAAEDIKFQRPNPSQIVQNIYETTINT